MILVTLCIYLYYIHTHTFKIYKHGVDSQRVRHVMFMAYKHKLDKNRVLLLEGCSVTLSYFLDFRTTDRNSERELRAL